MIVSLWFKMLSDKRARWHGWKCIEKAHLNKFMILKS